VDLTQTGAAATANTPLGPTESATPATDPIAAGSVEEPSTGAETGAPPGMSSSPASVVSSTGPETSDSDSRVANQVERFSGIKEIGRDGNTSRIFSLKPPFEVEKGFETSLDEIIKRTESVRAPLCATPVPNGTALYGTTEELFIRLQKAIAAQTSQSEQTCALLTYWTIASWFPDGLSFAPVLAIIGPAYEGDLVLCALRNFCRYPLMLTLADISSFKDVSFRYVNGETTPTLLFYAPYVTKQMTALLSCTATRGHLVSGAGSCNDFFGAKAIFLGEEVSAHRIPRCSVQVNVHATAAACATQKASRLTESNVQELQNMLLMYRTKNLVKVYNSDFDAFELTSDTRAIANALGACIVDSPKLQSELISLLMSLEDQRQTDRATSLEAVALEATLNLAHAGKTQVLVGEIACEVNRIMNERGERLHYSAEKIGHQLKKVGLVSRRLGKAGKGLVMDLATLTRVDELAREYGGAGLEKDENNLHCPLCTENK
jgi:hypothetical protein